MPADGHEPEAGAPERLFNAPIGSLNFRGHQYDVSPDGERFLIMELVDGESLADSLKKKRPSVEQSLKLAAEIARALEAGAFETGA